MIVLAKVYIIVFTPGLPSDVVIKQIVSLKLSDKVSYISCYN